MSNRKTITIEVEIPEIDVDNKVELKAFSEMLSHDLAEQIVAQVVSLHRADHIAYWQGMLRSWKIQDRLTEIKQCKKEIQHEAQRKIQP